MNNSKGYEKREKLFDIFSKNVANVKQHPSITIEPDLDDACVCPICMKLFPRDSLSYTKGYVDPLTLEDVPPESLGGKVRTLTCKICNNSAGSQLESHLKNRLDFEQALSGKHSSFINGAVRTENNVSVSASIKNKNDNFIKIYLDKERSDPKDFNQLTSTLNSGKPLNFSLDYFTKYKLNRPEVALLRIGYLIAYSKFGLGFIINPNLEIIREQINNPKEKLLKTWGITRYDFPDNIKGINIIREPKELRAFFIVFDIESNTNKSRIGVFLPGPTKPGLDIYSHIGSTKKSEKADIKVDAVHIFDKNYLTDPLLALASNDIWIDTIRE